MDWQRLTCLLTQPLIYYYYYYCTTNNRFYVDYHLKYLHYNSVTWNLHVHAARWCYNRRWYYSLQQVMLHSCTCHLRTKLYDCSCMRLFVQKCLLFLYLHNYDVSPLSVMTGFSLRLQVWPWWHSTLYKLVLFEHTWREYPCLKCCYDSSTQESKKILFVTTEHACIKGSDILQNGKQTCTQSCLYYSECLCRRTLTPSINILQTLTATLCKQFKSVTI